MDVRHLVGLIPTESGADRIGSTAVGGDLPMILASVFKPSDATSDQRALRLGHVEQGFLVKN
jgi:hypothetical protein